MTHQEFYHAMVAAGWPGDAVLFNAWHLAGDFGRAELELLVQYGPSFKAHQAVSDTLRGILSLNIGYIPTTLSITKSVIEGLSAFSDPLAACKARIGDPTLLWSTQNELSRAQLATLAYRQATAAPDDAIAALLKGEITPQRISLPYQEPASNPTTALPEPAVTLSYLGCAWVRQLYLGQAPVRIVGVSTSERPHSGTVDILVEQRGLENDSVEFSVLCRDCKIEFSLGWLLQNLWCGAGLPGPNPSLVYGERMNLMTKRVIMSLDAFSPFTGYLWVDTDYDPVKL